MTCYIFIKIISNKYNIVISISKCCGTAPQIVYSEQTAVDTIIVSLQKNMTLQEELGIK